MEEKEYSPMMEHYRATKAQNPDCILFYRLGDFYEMFFEDALLCSKELDLTLTRKLCGNNQTAPMCGVPHHAYEVYVKRLIDKGYRVAICEQVSEPGKSKLVQREVVRIITPGTVIEENILDSNENNYIASIAMNKKEIGLAYADISTGTLKLQLLCGEKVLDKLDDELAKLCPKEVIASPSVMAEQNELLCTMSGMVPFFYPYLASSFDLSRAQTTCKTHFQVNSLSAIGLSEMGVGISAVGALLDYLQHTQKEQAKSLSHVEVVRDSSYVHLDVNSRRNLELTESMSTHTKKGSLLWVLDKTKTSIGARTLKRFVSEPLADSFQINRRLEAVSALYSDSVLLSEVQELLGNLSDIERIASRISYGKVTPFDLLALKDTLSQMPKLRLLLEHTNSSLLQETKSQLNEITSLTGLIGRAIRSDLNKLEDNIKNGNFIAKGYSEKLDTLRDARALAQTRMLEYEKQQKEQTGIKNLKVGFNRVFGYFIEVPKSQLEKVPYEYNERKQTTVNAERFVTQALREMEKEVTRSEELAQKLEAELYDEIKFDLLAYVGPISSIAAAIGLVDTLSSFACVAQKNGYVKPEVSESESVIEIVSGRHPVVESVLAAGCFVPNDTLLDTDKNRTLIFTGPNMGGKSTYLRQVACITLMAHMGSFVPAKSAKIGVIDKLFTRIGASDDLMFGQSTFMVEMTEVANILNNATSRSLLIMDEVGRGTSTYDGLSIAWAVMEDLSERVKAKTLFATHYHELTTLEESLSGVKNYRVEVSEVGDRVVFTHKIMRGSANKSFGVHVAKMAGLPEHVITRANEVLSIEEARGKLLEESSGIANNKSPDSSHTKEIEQILRDTDMNTITPLVAFGTLQNLVDKAKS